MDLNERNKRRILSWLSVSLVLVFLLWMLLAIPLIFESSTLSRIVVCNVGQGDAVLVRSGFTTILIDAGPEGKLVTQCLRRFLPWFDHTIDLFVLSHQHDDHIGGAEEVLKRFPVQNVIWNGYGADTQVSQQLEQLLQKRGVGKVAVQGDTWRWPGGELSVVWPPPGWKMEDQNQSSLGVFIRFQSFGFLSLGDLECAQELAVAGGILLKHWQVAKISHHGSKTASCPQIFARNRPEVAFISLGEGNSYGHPDKETLQTLEQIGTLVLRTDQLGSLVLELRPEGIRWTGDRATQLHKK